MLRRIVEVIRPSDIPFVFGMPELHAVECIALTKKRAPEY
jgi:hypothetical protein